MVSPRLKIAMMRVSVRPGLPKIVFKVLIPDSRRWYMLSSLWPGFPVKSLKRK